MQHSQWSVALLSASLACSVTVGDPAAPTQGRANGPTKGKPVGEPGVDPAPSDPSETEPTGTPQLDRIDEATMRETLAPTLASVQDTCLKNEADDVKIPMHLTVVGTTGVVERVVLDGTWGTTHTGSCLIEAFSAVTFPTSKQTQAVFTYEVTKAAP